MKSSYFLIFLNIKVTFYYEFCILHRAQCVENAKPNIFLHFNSAMKMIQHFYLEVLK